MIAFETLTILCQNANKVKEISDELAELDPIRDQIKVRELLIELILLAYELGYAIGKAEEQAKRRRR